MRSRWRGSDLRSFGGQCPFQDPNLDVSGGWLFRFPLVKHMFLGDEKSILMSSGRCLCLTKTDRSKLKHTSLKVAMFGRGSTSFATWKHGSNSWIAATLSISQIADGIACSYPGIMGHDKIVSQTSNDTHDSRCCKLTAMSSVIQTDRWIRLTFIALGFKLVPPMHWK